MDLNLIQTMNSGDKSMQQGYKYMQQKLWLLPAINDSANNLDPCGVKDSLHIQ